METGQELSGLGKTQRRFNMKTAIQKLELCFVANTKMFDNEKDSERKGQHAYATNELGKLIADLKNISYDEAYVYLYKKYNLSK